MSTPNNGKYKAPVGALVAVAGTVIVTLILCVTFLVANGKETAEIFRLVNFLVSAVGTLISALAAAYAAKASRRSDDAASAVNGGLEDKIAGAIRKAHSDG
jgi:multisubunit Na+/H+ antiporter MnhB subunit